MYAGLALYGAGTALLVEAGLGLGPRIVLDQGLAKLTGLTIGVMPIIAGAVVLLLWIPQAPGPRHGLQRLRGRYRDGRHSCGGA